MLLRGNGFWKFMVPPRGSTSNQSQIRWLPGQNFLDLNDANLVRAILAEALSQDRERFGRYLSARPLGLGLITGVSTVTFYDLCPIHG